MGILCSKCCCGCNNNNDNNTTNDTTTNTNKMTSAEIELQTQQAEKDMKLLSIARGMSAPTIEVIDRTKIMGRGLALTAVVLEQDSAYWEVHVLDEQQQQSSNEVTTQSIKCNAMFGVASKKDRQFYETLETLQDGDASSSSETNGTNYMCPIPVSHGDVVGVIMQQSDLPMLQFMLNGEQIYTTYINRFRGIVYPSILLPNEVDDTEHNFSLRIVFNESDFKYKPPSSKFIPVMVARGLV